MLEEWSSACRARATHVFVPEATRTSALLLNDVSQRSIQWVELRLAADVRCIRWKPGRPIRHAVLCSVVPTGC